MLASDPASGSPFARAWWLILAGAIADAAGCVPVPPDDLVVATSWPSADRRRLEAEFADWLQASRLDLGSEPVRIRWLAIDPGEDLLRLVERPNPPDVLLGGRDGAFAVMSRTGRLSPLGPGESPGWLVARRSTIRLTGPESGPAEPDRGIEVETTRGRDGTTPPEPVGRRTTFDDPRKDPISLAWAKGLLGSDHFRVGYQRLVQSAGHPRRIGRQSGSARAAVLRGEAELAPCAVAESDGEPARRAVGTPLHGTNRGVDEAEPVPWIEGAAIPRGVRHLRSAQAFLRYLGEIRRCGPGPEPTEADPDTDSLLGDLLGSTLVDAQDELWGAWTAVHRAGEPEAPLRWMCEPPPWPPAFVAKLQSRGGERAMSLMETLAAELAPDPEVRAWLIRSWLSPPRAIDLTLLDELAHCVDGRLFREPRIREWLRAEWTDWARQRYRRVARLALSGQWPVVSGQWSVIEGSDFGIAAPVFHRPPTCLE